MIHALLYRAAVSRLNRRRALSIAILVTLASGFVGCVAPCNDSTADAGPHETTNSAAATPDSTEPRPALESAERLAESAMPSLVVITHHGRDGGTDGIGAGFVISEDGLIATSLHVIGEARPIRVQLRDGTRHIVRSVHAWDRKLDLAIIQIDATGLQPLPLGDSDMLRQGAAIVALGNPQGMANSITRGVLSARRTVEGAEMLQLAVPVEPGNSGGPILDADGKVQGVMTLKSAVTENLGFAIPVNDLRQLLDAPNPVPMERWLTIGALNPRQWTIVHGGRWTQRAGRIRVEGAGAGFGGRALCLAEGSSPELPFEMTVSVKLDDESGAAGIVFGSDGGDRHYGFYPSNGQLRLTRFDGPDVFSWQVLEQVRVPAYRRGDWNTLRVRVESERITCHVNDQLAIEVDNPRFAGGRVGLAKFRDTSADFKAFRLGDDVSPREVPPELLAAIENAITRSSERTDPALLTHLQATPEASRVVLIERARSLEIEAVRIRRLAASVHREDVRRRIADVLEAGEPSLAHAALLVALLDNPDINVDAYLEQLDHMVTEVRDRLPEDAGESARLNALRNFLFVENGFHGSRTDFYNLSNSYLNEVMDDREGLPITLSILFVELGRRLGIGHLDPTVTPGHMLVRHAPPDAPIVLIDPFESGKLPTHEEVEELVVATTGARFRGEHLRRSTPLETVIRLLGNLRGIAEQSAAPEAGIHYLDLAIALDPDAAIERLQRGMLRLRIGDLPGAREDLSWLVENEPQGLDIERIADLLRTL